jgi:hypothetical protein
MAYLLIGPGETLDYSVDWTGELDAGSPSDAITASSWSVTPQDEASPERPSLSGDSTSGAITAVRLADCTGGAIYRLTNRVETALGLILERSITIRCENR